MHKLLLAGVALVTLTVASPVLAQSNDGATAAGATAGATTGGTLGFIFGGPIGAVIGGFTGAAIGGSVADNAVTYAGNHPVKQIYLDDSIDVGYRVGTKIKVYPVDGDEQHGYFYANNRVWIVDRETGEVVASPGYVVPEHAVSYVKAHPTASITLSGDIRPGYKLDSNVTFSEIPDARGYAYFYVGDRPALVDTHTRTVIWVQ